MRVLGIETSCDETGVALYEAGSGIRAERLASQIPIHAAYGGVVPELASRDHIAKLLPMVESVLADAGLGLRDLDAIAYTAGPGLIGALLVGGSLASSLAYALKIPAIPVHHLEGHILACMLETPAPGVSVPRADGLGRALAADRGCGRRPLPDHRRNARRRGRRGVRQGRAAARAAVPGRAGARGAGGARRCAAVCAAAAAQEPRSRHELQRAENGRAVGDRRVPRRRRLVAGAGPRRRRGVVSSRRRRHADGQSAGRRSRPRASRGSSSRAASAPIARCARASPSSAGKSARACTIRSRRCAPTTAP